MPVSLSAFGKSPVGRGFCFQVAGSLPDTVFYGSLNAFKRIGNLPYPGENDTLPDPHAFIIGNISDFFLISEVTVLRLYLMDS
jgi:hypothetical protein